jgi:hypothetical protein
MYPKTNMQVSIASNVSYLSSPKKHDKKKLKITYVLMYVLSSEAQIVSRSV